MSRIEDGEAVEAGRDLVAWLEGAAAYFEKRPTNGEDRAHWANIFNAENCRAAAAEITRLRAEVERLSKPDMFWFWQDPEYACEGWQEALEETGSMAEVIRFQTAHELPDRWGAHRVLTVDEHGDPDETKPALFDTEAEASACWPDSLAAARAVLSNSSQAEGQTP